MSSQVKESVRFIRSKVSIRPRIAIILGSGLGDFADTVVNKKTFETSRIPHYPQSNVEGHSGKLIFGKLSHVSVLAFQGRIHFYETGNLESVLYPIRLAHGLGIKTLIVTNAAGAVNRQFNPGDLMLITDQINLTFENPLRHLRLPIANLQLYDVKLQKLILQVAKENKIDLKQGVYCGIKGPSYETAAEIEMIRRIGGDAVGMSTVNEVSLAVALGMRVAGISVITNLSTGITTEKLSHLDVTEVATRVRKVFANLMSRVIEKIT
ncbi:MAG: purine-nucleoside phosphorylase [Ignavibacteriae bacterium]|nr:purine-nucleoside phosphorylase [Ignavibacteriota bacterium]